jgi:hypothetical protein
MIERFALRLWIILSALPRLLNSAPVSQAAIWSAMLYKLISWGVVVVCGKEVCADETQYYFDSG